MLSRAGACTPEACPKPKTVARALLPARTAGRIALPRALRSALKPGSYVLSAVAVRDRGWTSPVKFVTLVVK